MSRSITALAGAVSVSLVLSTMPVRVQAAGVPAEAVAQAEGLLPAAGTARQQLASALARDDVAAALRAQGVDPAAVQARVDSLTDAEAQALAARLADAPAGGSDVLGTIVFLFVLLLITDILGFTKVFPFTRSIR
ncbi:MAG: PA2779 family protein [Burkholderiaceae bacterium]|nr:PA2779 family protein [Burkholderiaceae bacterium]